jgi:hypothetical protein
LALATAALMQQSISSADAKIATMTGVVCGSALFLAGQFVGLDDLGRVGAGRLSVGLLLGVMAVAGLAGAAWQLGDGLWPRLDRHRRAGSLSITILAADTADGGSLVAAADDCWQLVRTLARIAVTKHERVRRSLLWTALALTGMAGIVLCRSLPPGIAIGAGG